MTILGTPRLLYAGRARARGVTAIELIIIVSLMVMLAAVAVPTMSPVVMSSRLRGAAWQLAGDLRLTRQKAITFRLRHRVCVANCALLSLSAGQYSIEREQTFNNWLSDSGGVAAKLPADVTMTTTASGGRVTFDQKGMASGATFTLTNLSGSYEVKIGATGRVRVCQGVCPS
jgi:Tfp pilus assembly protein FimT